MLKVKLDEAAGIAVLQPENDLSKEDFLAVGQEIDPYIEKNGRLNGIIIHVKDFPSWDSFSSFLAHITFVKEHHKQVAKVAFSTDSFVSVIAEHVANHFVRAEVKSFPYEAIETAKDWVLDQG